MLPAASPHLVVRVGGDPLRVAATPSAPATQIGTAVVAGSRWEPYVRSMTGTGRTVGALLAPGASTVLFGVPGCEFAGGHVALSDVAPGTSLLEEALDETVRAYRCLDLLEQFLLSNVRRYTGIHPAVRHALERLASRTRVRDVVAETGYSHRRFNEHFRAAVGMAPKLYCRVMRFERTLARLQANPACTLAAVASDSGYSDQAHLCREFREFAGMTLTEYTRCAESLGSRHVSLAPTSEGGRAVPLR